MVVIFSEHAKHQLAERRLNEEEVRSTVSYPDKVIIQPNKRIRALKFTNINDKRYLIVAVYERINTTAKVITIFITSKIRKYMQE